MKTGMEVSNEIVMDMFQRVLRIRRFEEKVGKLFSQGQLPGFVHLYIGEEAVASGVCAALSESDYIVSTHRGHGHLIAKGGDFKKMMAELFGKYNGYCKGKGGSMHIADFKIGMLGACGIVGGGLPIAVGAALSSYCQGSNRVAVTFFGDGASNEGSFHESINLASVMKLPVVFVCENNHYGEFTPAIKAANIENIADRATGYGIPGVIVDGSDPIEVYKAAKEAVERARKGDGPTLIEAKTHRKGGHAEGEKAFLAGQKYRIDEEEKAAQEKDPLLKITNSILQSNIATQKVLDDMDKKIQDQIEEAVRFAMDSPYPSVDVLYEDRWA